MRRSNRGGLVVVCLFGAALVALIITGVLIGSTWATFVPDLIVGVVGAGAISATIAWAQFRSDVRRGNEDRVSAAYELLLDRVQGLIHLDLTEKDAILGVNKLHQDMRRLSELVDRPQPAFERWFEAEQQLGMYRLSQAGDELDVIHDKRPITPEDNYAALEKHCQWLSEYSNNVRYWRTGNLSADEMLRQATTIETSLRNVGGWRDDAMPWRNGQ